MVIENIWDNKIGIQCLNGLLDTWSYKAHTRIRLQMLLVKNHLKLHLLVEIIGNKIIQLDLIHEKSQNNEHQQGTNTYFCPRTLVCKYSSICKRMDQIIYKKSIQSKTKLLIPNYEDLIIFMNQIRINNSLIK